MKTPLRFLALTVGMVGAIVIAAPVAENWDNHCAKCHGADGKAQTKVGKKLKVRDYTAAAVQAEMKDDEMLKAIAEGVKNEQGKETMKSYKDELSAEEMAELVAFIRKFKS
jgi:cytochrome c553